MVREQLEASNGHVRCGHCMVVFDASTPLDEASLELPPAEEIHADLSFVQQAQKEAFWSKKSVRIGLLMTSLVLMTLLILQVIRTQQERIAQVVPSMEPVAQKLCLLWTCQKAVRLQMDGWRIESSSFQKEGANAFRLTVQLKNISQATLLVPQLELSLLDTSDAVLVRRTLVLTEDQSIPSGEEHLYHFLITPQSNLRSSILGYRLVLFYP
jgi:hypothetical protein